MTPPRRQGIDGENAELYSADLLSRDRVKESRFHAAGRNSDAVSNARGDLFLGQLVDDLSSSGTTLLQRLPIYELNSLFGAVVRAVPRRRRPRDE